MEINIYNNYGDIDFDYEEIVEDVKKGFHNFSDKEVSLSLILVNLDEIHNINLQYRHIDRSTDVISFESDEEEDYIGDIFICIDKVIAQANEYAHSVYREFAFLLIHGILHLHGYDHLTQVEEDIMFQKQDEIIEKINVGGKYGKTL